MIEPCDPKHSDVIEEDAKPDSNGAYSYPIYGNESEMAEPKRAGANPVDVTWVFLGRLFESGIIQSCLQVVTQFPT